MSAVSSIKNETEAFNFAFSYGYLLNISQLIRMVASLTILKGDLVDTLLGGYRSYRDTKISVNIRVSDTNSIKECFDSLLAFAVRYDTCHSQKVSLSDDDIALLTELDTSVWKACYTNRMFWYPDAFELPDSSSDNRRTVAYAMLPATEGSKWSIEDESTAKNKDQKYVVGFVTALSLVPCDSRIRGTESYQNFRSEFIETSALILASDNPLFDNTFDPLDLYLKSIINTSEHQKDFVFTELTDEPPK